MFDRLVRTYQDWRAARETVDKLSRLSDRQLKDIGLSRADIKSVARGARRPGVDDDRHSRPALA